MTDLLSPEEAKEIQEEKWHVYGCATYDPMPFPCDCDSENVARLCRDYLTLWDRVTELNAVLDKRDSPLPQFHGPEIHD